ncbi:MAG: endolytic transglycosylase MltG [Actinomycetota bacterium]|nr:endolytic transglycosylase MltG [Actinomycetota bacterium]
MEQPTSGAAPTRTDDRPRRATLIALLVAFLILVSGVVSVGRYYQHCKSGSDQRRPLTFTVAEGASGSQVVNDLADDDVIACGGLVGRILLQKNGLGSQIRAGTYQLTTGMTLDEAMAVLTAPTPAVPTITTTIPEGYGLTQIAGAFAHALKIPEARFLARAHSGGYALPPYLPAGKPTLEGFLFPDTYEFVKKGTTADDVIGKMLDRFATVAHEMPFANAEKLGVTPYQAVIIASLVEKEAAAPADRPLVAAVIYNRLKIDMKLGIDATVAYIDPDPSDGLTSSDFRIRSPYNTRLYAGLPPTPIASPGKASLEAALQPTATDDLYFVACPGDARMLFSQTYAEFLNDKACIG